MYASKDCFYRQSLRQAYEDLSGPAFTTDGCDDSFEYFLKLVKPVGPLHKGVHIFHQGDSFDDLSLVRVGCVKSYYVSVSGDERVTEFCLPGNLVGINDFYARRHSVSAVALDTLMLYQLPIEDAEKAIKGLSMRLLLIMSRNLHESRNLFSKQTAANRVTSFLNNYGNRLRNNGLSRTHYILPMSRMDIGNYLRLSQETVSRELTRLQSMGVIRLKNREVKILN